MRLAAFNAAPSPTFSHVLSFSHFLCVSPIFFCISLSFCLIHLLVFLPYRSVSFGLPLQKASCSGLTGLFKGMCLCVCIGVVWSRSLGETVTRERPWSVGSCRRESESFCDPSWSDARSTVIHKSITHKPTWVEFLHQLYKRAHMSKGLEKDSQTNSLCVTHWHFSFQRVFLHMHHIPIIW